MPRTEDRLKEALRAHLSAVWRVLRRAGGDAAEPRKLVVLSDKWQRFEVTWGELQQRGYGRPPLDPSSLHSLQFLVRPEDSPFDVWIDDVAFLERSTSSSSRQKGSLPSRGVTAQGGRG